MLQSIRAFRGGLHFRFVMLVIGLAIVLMASQLVTDTVSETKQVRSQRLSDAIAITAVLARSLEGQFEYFELDEIESILESVRTKQDVRRIAVVDRDHTFFLDGDIVTSPLVPFDRNEAQEAAISEMKTVHDVGETKITVAEPLINNGRAIGSVLIEYENPNMLETVWPIVKSKLAMVIPIMIVGLTLAMLLVSQITKPLRNLSSAALAFSRGDLEQDVKVEGQGEIRQLGEAFKTMISTLRQNIEQIYELAYVDRVTQLPNREFFRRELTKAIKSAQRKETTGALLFVDLDGFKKVNDTLGHDLGDKLLLKFSERIATVLRADDVIAYQPAESVASMLDDDHSLGMGGDGTHSKHKEKQVLARLGGDEFTVLLSEIREETDAASVARRIIEAVSEPFRIGETEISIGASIGISTFPREGADFQSVLKNADMAMYQAKEEGKNTYRYFSEDLNRRASKRLETEMELRLALQRDEFELFYQPKVCTKTGKAKSVEALIRWRHPERGIVGPMEFIGVAEDTGLIMPIGKWVLEEACRQLKHFEDEGVDLSIAVNISTHQFSRNDFSEMVLMMVREMDVNPARLELEITESMAMENPDRALKHILALKKVGIRLAIDDFGTGFSNLAQLSRFPFDVFKIDRTFISALANQHDEHGRVIVKTILAMAQSLNYETVAEGVETVEQMDFLSELGCTYSQGYLFAKPMPSGDLADWMESRNQGAARSLQMQVQSAISKVG